MATRKTIAEPVEEVKKTSEEIAQEKSVEDYLNERVHVRLFRGPGKFNEDVIVIINGKTWQIQRGMDVLIPRYVANVIRAGLDQDEKTEMMIEGMRTDK